MALLYLCFAIKWSKYLTRVLCEYVFVSIYAFCLGCRSFVPVQVKTCNQVSSKSFQNLQRNHEERASTLPRIKPKTLSFTSHSAKPSISIFSASHMNASLPRCSVKPEPDHDSQRLASSERIAPSPLLHQLPVNPSVSLALTVPTPRLSPSPTPRSQEMTSYTQENKQPSPVARDRLVRSIPISNAQKDRLSSEAKHDILDQDTLLDFTRKDLKRTSKGFQQQTLNRDSASHNPPTICQNSSALQGKLEFIKTGNIAKNKPLPKTINSPVSPETNITPQQGQVPNEKAVSEGIKSTSIAQSKSQIVFEELATHLSPNLQRKCINYLQNASLKKTHNKRYTETRKALEMSPKMMDSTESCFYQTNVSPKLEAKRKQLGPHNQTFTSRTVPQKDERIQTSHVTSFSHRLSQHQSETAETDTWSAVHQSNSALKDYSCQSSHMGRQVEASECTHTLNPLKTRLVEPQKQNAIKPVSSSSKQEQLSGKNTNGKGMIVTDTGQNKSVVLSQCTHSGVSGKRLEYNNENCFVSKPSYVARCPMDTNTLGISSKWGLQNNTSACVMEKEEEPYVTMYCPGSVYVGEYSHMDVKLNRTSRTKFLSSSLFFFFFF